MNARTRTTSTTEHDRARPGVLRAACLVGRAVRSHPGRAGCADWRPPGHRGVGGHVCGAAGSAVQWSTIRPRRAVKGLIGHITSYSGQYAARWLCSLMDANWFILSALIHVHALFSQVLILLGHEPS